MPCAMPQTPTCTSGKGTEASRPHLPIRLSLAGAARRNSALALPTPPFTPLPTEDPFRRIPLTLATSSNAPVIHSTSPDSHFAGNRLRILIVDDNYINVQILSRSLRHHTNHLVASIHTATSGIVALELLQHLEFDCIFLDIDMPVLCGILIAQHIRKANKYPILESNRHACIVAVTTKDTAEWKQVYAQTGMNGCIGKPFGPNTLRNVMEGLAGVRSFSVVTNTLLTL
ncbi:CheY-like superfamily [Jimgerdemannia flammicorona]|uniref:CheY-like superfamily n=1 Tax=Jimgerdemannia flammicorona TaxID=994334 RepID=A0A433QGL8_9FUNG|nr:CheY-like superfamily [Jimgerdemannia flammicorona]